MAQPELTAPVSCDSDQMLKLLPSNVACLQNRLEPPFHCSSTQACPQSAENGLYSTICTWAAASTCLNPQPLALLHRQLAGDDTDLQKQYTDLVQQPPAPFADLRMHSNRRDDKQTAVGSPTGLGVSPFGKASQAGAPWQQQQPTPDNLGSSRSSSQAQLANGLHGGQAGGNEEAAAAAVTNGDPGAGSSSDLPSSAGPTANGAGPRSPSFARVAAGAGRSNSVAAGGVAGLPTCGVCAKRRELLSFQLPARPACFWMQLFPKATGTVAPL